MKFYQKLTGIVAAFILLAAPVAFAAENVGNSDTGNGSNNEVTIRDESDVRIETRNNKVEENEVVVSQSTGENVAMDNNGENEEEDDNNSSAAVAIATGNTDANVSIDNVENISKVSVGGANEEEEQGQPEEEEVPVVTPSGIGGGELAEAVTPSGIGGGELAQAGGIGGGELPESGFDGLIWPFILASVTTVISYFRLKKGFSLNA